MDQDRRIDFVAKPEHQRIISDIQVLLGGCDMTTAIRAALGLADRIKLQIHRSNLIKDD